MQGCLRTSVCPVPAAFAEKASPLTRLMKDYYPKGTENVKCSNKKPTQFFKKGQKALTPPPPEGIQMAHKHVKSVPHDMSSGNANQNDEIPLQISGLAKIQC